MTSLIGEGNLLFLAARIFLRAHQTKRVIVETFGNPAMPSAAEKKLPTHPVLKCAMTQPSFWKLTEKIRWNLVFGSVFFWKVASDSTESSFLWPLVAKKLMKRRKIGRQNSRSCEDSDKEYARFPGLLLAIFFTVSALVIFFKFSFSLSVSYFLSLPLSRLTKWWFSETAVFTLQSSEEVCRTTMFFKSSRKIDSSKK